MDNRELSDLVTREVERALKVNDSEVGSFKVLAILTHFGQGLQPIIDSLIQLAKENVPILLWTVDELERRFMLRTKTSSISSLRIEVKKDQEFSVPQLKELDYIIYGAFSFEIADKIITFQDQDPIVNILLQGLFQKIPVYILTPCPISELIFEYRPSSKINRELRKRLSMLTEIGFHLLDEGDIISRSFKRPHSPPELITESYIEELRGKVKEIRISHSTIITPLAKEKASELDIRIIRI